MLNTFNCGLNAHTTGGSSRSGIMAGNVNCFSIVHVLENNRQSAPSRRRMARQDVGDKRWRKGKGGKKMNLCRKWSFGVSWPRSRTLRDPARRGGRVKNAKLLFLVFFSVRYERKVRIEKRKTLIQCVMCLLLSNKKRITYLTL